MVPYIQLKTNTLWQLCPYVNVQRPAVPAIQAELNSILDILRLIAVYEGTLSSGTNGSYCLKWLDDHRDCGSRDVCRLLGRDGWR